MSGRYDREFKLEAIRLAEEPGSSAAEVERCLGIGLPWEGAAAGR